MGQEELHLLAVLAKYILLPVIAFFAGFIAKWFLQERKSRDELLEALASPRAEALRELWAITTLRPKIASLKEGVAVPSDPPFQLLANCSMLSRLLMKRGIFIRGGITDGPMFHSGSMAFGPALTAAYDLENRSAVTPRIVTPSRSTGEPHLMFTPDPKSGFRTNFWRKDKCDMCTFLMCSARFLAYPSAISSWAGIPRFQHALKILRTRYEPL